MEIPGHKEWNGGYGCLDGQCAFKNFNGVSYEKAVKMFHNASYVYQEDLYYMPIKVCEFYFRSYAEYILSADSRGDFEGALFFMSAFVNLEKEILSFSDETKDYIVSAAHYILDNEESFDEDGVIDEGMQKRLQKMKKIKLY